MNFAILLIDIGVIAFLVWGFVLSLVSIALDEAWNSGSAELPHELRGYRANSHA
jgi:hypothetical protein